MNKLSHVQRHWLLKCAQLPKDSPIVNAFPALGPKPKPKPLPPVAAPKPAVTPGMPASAQVTPRI